MPSRNLFLENIVPKKNTDYLKSCVFYCFMAVHYKQKCFRCKKNYVAASWKNRFVQCYDCQKNELAQEVKNPKMKKLFAIPEEFYKESAFLRDIKMNYFKFRALSEKQLEAFKKVVKEMKEGKKEVKEVEDVEIKKKVKEVKEVKK